MKLIPFSRYKIVGHSMEPILKNGQVVWVNNWAYLINKEESGDIVVFKREDQELIKRITKITRDNLVLTGDNQEDSLDSKSFGGINRKAVVGKVMI